MSSAKQDLERAFRLIKQDETQEALQIVEPIVQNDPENVDAWWLLAYAATEPSRVREALLTVLRLDPDYANAPRAREMLQKLNVEYPPHDDELIRFPELQTEFASDEGRTGSYFGSDIAIDNPFETLGELAPAETHVETFDSAEFDNDNLFFTDDTEPFTELEDDPFASFSDEEADAIVSSVSSFETIDDDPFAMDEFATTKPESERKGKRVKLAIEEELSEELAAAEEKRAGGHRGRRFFRTLVAALLLLLVAAAVFFLTQGEDDTVADLEELQIVASDSTDVERAKISATQNLDTRNLGTQHRAIVATSELGDTLFVEVCSRPTPNMPQLIKQAMQIAAQEAPAVDGILPAIGVNVALCQNDAKDTLFRSVTPVQNALTYLGQTNTQDEEEAWIDFQSIWLSS